MKILEFHEGMPIYTKDDLGMNKIDYLEQEIRELKYKITILENIIDRWKQSK